MLTMNWCLILQSKHQSIIKFMPRINYVRTQRQIRPCNSCIILIDQLCLRSRHRIVSLYFLESNNSLQLVILHLLDFLFSSAWQKKARATFLWVLYSSIHLARLLSFAKNWSLIFCCNDLQNFVVKNNVSVFKNKSSSHAMLALIDLCAQGLTKHIAMVKKSGHVCF